MFPDRVGRIILDGVCDADHYVGPVWMDSIRDADAVFNSFPRFCFEGGSSCSVYRPGDSVSDIAERLFGALEDLKINPIVVTDIGTNTPVVITYSDIRRTFFSSLYAPIMGFQIIAWVVGIIIEKNYLPLAPLFALPYPFSMVCQQPAPAWQYPNEAQYAIMCSDKRYPLNETVPNLKLMFEQMSNTSSWADVWLTVMLGCEGWGIEAIDPPMRWDDHPAHKQKPINTSFPVMFIGNTFDPVTPLQAALNMTKKFVGAGLIEQKSMGHCSIAAVSKCTIKKVKEYFTEGKVPPPPTEGEKNWDDGDWERCEADEWPFHPHDGAHFTALNEVEAQEDMAMTNAWKAMQDVFASVQHYGQPGLIPSFDWMAVASEESKPRG